jgi:hypothetical protein
LTCRTISDKNTNLRCETAIELKATAEVDGTVEMNERQLAPTEFLKLSTLCCQGYDTRPLEAKFELDLPADSIEGKVIITAKAKCYDMPNGEMEWKQTIAFNTGTAELLVPSKSDLDGDGDTPVDGDPDDLDPTKKKPR